MTNQNTNSKEWDETLNTPESQEFLKKNGDKALKDFNSGDFQSLADFAKEFEEKNKS